MDKKNKSLIDNNEGDFILNETGTSVNNPWDSSESPAKDEKDIDEEGKLAQEDKELAKIESSAGSE